MYTKRSIIFVYTKTVTHLIKYTMKHLFKALAAFQQEVKPIFKGTKGYGYSYADLPTIFDKINPLLQKHGLGFTQLINTLHNPTCNGEDNYLNTIIFHVESGETLESNTLIPQVNLKNMNDYQSFGSGVSYFRRYCISSCLGLVTDVDNDGAGQQQPKANQNKNIKLVEKVKPSISNERFEKAVALIQEGKYTVEKLRASYMLTDLQIKSLQVAELC